MIVNLIILAVVVYLIFYVLGHVPLPEPIKTVVYIVFGLLVILKLLQYI